jgi:abhydrolase domain-containing protein 6
MTMKKIIGYLFGVVVVIIVLVALAYFLFPESVFKMAVNAQRRSADLVRKEIQVDDHKIVYLEGGKGETVVLLHGFGGNKDHWTAFANCLKGYRLVIPDVSGFGESSQVPADSYDVESQVKRIDRFAEALKLDKFHMAGNSLGGAYTATYGARYPGKVLTLALLDPAGAPSPNKSELIKEAEKGNNLLLASNVVDFNKLLSLVYVKMPFAVTLFGKIFAADWIAHTEFNKKIFKDWQPEKYTLEPVLPLIQAPVLIIWGDGDKVLDIGGVAFLEKNLKKHKTVIMKDMGHSPMLERPKETAKVYEGFLGEKR